MLIPPIHPTLKPNWRKDPPSGAYRFVTDQSKATILPQCTREEVRKPSMSGFTHHKVNPLAFAPATPDQQ